MLSDFGKLAGKHREHMGLTLEEFAALMRLSVEEIEAFEQQRAICDDEIVDQYQQVLGIAEGSQPHLDLANAAQEANARFSYHRKFLGDDRLMALLARHGESLSHSAKAEINRIVADEIARQASQPQYRPDQPASEDTPPAPPQKQPAPERSPLPSLTPVRLAQLILLSEDIRCRYVEQDKPLSAVAFLRAEATADNNLALDVCENMPLFAPDAEVVIAGARGKHTVFAQEAFIKRCSNDPKFLGNHALLHEYAHHCLHADAIMESEAGFMPLQTLTRYDGQSSPNLEDSTPYEWATQAELEADFFAALLAIPWIKLAEVAIEGYRLRFMIKKLARDHGTPEQVADRLVRYLRLDVARDRIRADLYKTNRLDHPFLLLL